MLGEGSCECSYRTGIYWDSPCIRCRVWLLTLEISESLPLVRNGRHIPSMQLQRLEFLNVVVASHFVLFQERRKVVSTNLKRDVRIRSD
jgi:hypothetical protein